MRRPGGLLPYALTAATTRSATEAAGPALLLSATAFGRNPSAGALLLASLTATAGVCGPLVGVALDRAVRPARVFVASMIVFGGSFVVLTFLLADLPLWAACLIAVAGGLGLPALTGGWTAQLGHLVEPSRINGAYAVDAATYNLGALLGPAMAAGALAIGPRWPLVGVVLLVGAALVVMTRVPIGRRVPLEGDGNARLLAGLRALVAVPALRSSTVVTTIAQAGMAAVVVGAPSLSRGLTGALPFAGLFLTALAVGGLTSNGLLFLRPLRRPDAVISVSAALIGVGMVIAALATTPWVALVGAVVAGACDGVMITAMFIVRNREAPVHARGQVFTVAASLRTAAFAAAGAGLSPLADRPAVWVLGIGAAIQVAAIVLGRLSVLRRPGAGGQATV